MTSKISYYSLRRENMKHRIGMILIIAFVFFAYMVEFLMSVQNICSRYLEKPRIRESITGLSEPGMSMGATAMLAGVLLAISGFRYLHSRREVDFYHSLPIKRKTYLYIIMTNDLLIFTVFLVVLLCFQCMIAGFSGYFSAEFGRNTVWTFLCCLAVFEAFYLTMTLAMILTGQTFVGVLGFGVMLSYMPLILRNLYPFLASAFFKTYCADEKWGEAFQFFSPASLAGRLLIDSKIWTWKAHAAVFAAICIWILAIGAAVFILFERRPSETAGKAMAFPRVNSVIRVMLVIPVSIYAGLYLYSCSFNSFKIWIIAGIIIGGFFCHGAVESIFRFDIRGLIACKRQMLLSILAALLIVGFFWTDLSGYDAYLPENEETASILIDEGSMQDAVFWGKERKGVSGETKERVLHILTDVVESNDKNNAQYKKEWNNSEHSSFDIRYRLKNGKEKRRSYVLDKELKDRLMREVFDTKEYREDHYSLYTGDWSCVKDVDFWHFTDITELKLTEEQKEKLFDIYLEDFAEFDYEEAKTEIPFGRLVLNREEDMGGAYAYNSVSCGGIADSYYVYPSFKKTTAYLEELMNEKLEVSFEEVLVSKIDVWQYDEDGLSDEFSIKEEAFIRSVQGKFLSGNILEGGGSFYPVDMSLDITLTIAKESGNEQVNVYTDADTIKKIKVYREREK